MAVNLVATSRKAGRHEEAIEMADQMVKEPMRASDKEKISVNKANVHLELQCWEEAEAT